ncbi:mobile mystery protein B [Pedobacter frigoris]|uniref:Mobile mystery protein B n=1 Tax=Pedobacter frigoris TaxID=2571272 RepID=A0A4U1CIA2_9SPHI|nr:mobile mystery protein B [Pedobacter frigoris]TKC07127.1 mobile mystery protein B [Pedobacter frigoris]
MGLEIDYIDGQTPLDEEEKDGLLIPFITTRGELDEAEQRNIEEAMLWLRQRRKRFTALEILSEQFILTLHVKMLSGVWRWAGSFRKSEKNIGVKSYLISADLRALLDDCKYWVEHMTYHPNEIAIRFKHRIVSIHCFENGNGRHSRLIADVVVNKIFELDAFTWGGHGLTQGSDMRTKYIAALRNADKGNFEPLIKFARS